MSLLLIINVYQSIHNACIRLFIVRKLPSSVTHELWPRCKCARCNFPTVRRQLTTLPWTWPLYSNLNSQRQRCVSADTATYKHDSDCTLNPAVPIHYLKITIMAWRHVSSTYNLFRIIADCLFVCVSVCVIHIIAETVYVLLVYLSHIYEQYYCIRHINSCTITSLSPVSWVK